MYNGELLQPDASTSADHHLLIAQGIMNPPRFSHVLAVAFLCAGGATPNANWAATSSMAFVVQVRLQSGISALTPLTCISGSLSQETGAQVSVLCDSNQVVQIETKTSGTYVGTHGSAFRNVVIAEHSAEAGATARSGWSRPMVSPTVVSPMLFPELKSDGAEFEVFVTF